MTIAIAKLKDGELEKLPEEEARELIPEGADEDEVLEMYDGPYLFASRVEGEDQKAVPDNAVSIDSPAEAPEGARVIEGDRGGLYYIPADGEEGEGDGGGIEADPALQDIADDEGNIDAADLEPGDRPLINGEPGEVQQIASDETGTVVIFEREGEEFFIYEDMLDLEAPGAGEEEDDPGGEDDDFPFEEGDTIESPTGEPVMFLDRDPDTGVVMYGTEDGETMLMGEETLLGEDQEEEEGGRNAELEERLDIPTVDLDELDDDQAETVASALEEYEERVGLPEMSILSLTTHPPDDVGSTAGASYTLNQRKMYVNPDGLDPEAKQDDFDGGWIATESIEGTIFHEAAHAVHFNSILGDPDADLGEMKDAEFGDEQADLIEEEVSWYASTSPTEMVAEVHSGMLEGHEYPDKVMDMYESFGGPEVEA